jgi:hypothetical protein
MSSIGVFSYTTDKIIILNPNSYILEHISFKIKHVNFFPNLSQHMISDRDKNRLIKKTIPNYIHNLNSYHCTICNSALNSRTTEIGIYSSDVNVSERDRTKLTVDVIFCNKCNPEHSRLPHLGINELNLSATLQKNKNKIDINNIRVNHESLDGSGIVWNPCKLWENVTKYPCSDIDESPSAAYVSELLYQANIPIFSKGENPAVYGGRESDTC